MTDGSAPSQERLQHLVDRQDIYDRITQVSRAIDRFDKALFVSAYHDDAVIDAGGLVADPATVYDHGKDLHEQGQKSTLHNLMNHRCDIDGDIAHAETYFLYTGVNQDDTNWVAGGRYVDRLERRAGEWKISFRLTTIEWSGIVPRTVVPLFEGVPDIGLNGTPSRNASDPSYVRPLENRRERRVPDDAGAMGTPPSA